jgi:Flp pilus assembly protein TadG
MVSLGSEAVREPSRPHSRRLPGRLLRSERGTAVVEFALVALPLFLILLGIIDFARALNYYNDLTQIAGQGARAATVDQNPNGGAADSQFQFQLACEASTPELRKGVSVQITTMPTNVGDPVTVKTSYAFNFLPLIRVVPLTLTATETERYEAPTAPSFSPSSDVLNGAGTGSCP